MKESLPDADKPPSGREVDHDPKWGEKRFEQLPAEGKAAVLSGLERTRAVIGAYLRDKSDSFVPSLSQLRILHKDILSGDGIGMHIPAHHFKELYNQLHNGLAKEGYNVDDIRGMLQQAKTDIETMLVALRRKTGDDSPLGDAVNLSDIGVSVAQAVEKEEYPAPRFDRHQVRQPSQRRWSEVPKAETGVYQSSEFFNDLHGYLKKCSASALDTLHDYCHDKAGYEGVDSQIRYDLGIALWLSKGFRMAIATSLERGPDGTVKVVDSPEKAQANFDRLQEVSAQRGGRPVGRSGDGGGRGR